MQNRRSSTRAAGNLQRLGRVQRGVREAYGSDQSDDQTGNSHGVAIYHEPNEPWTSHATRGAIPPPL